MLREAFGKHSLSWTAVFEWHTCFKAGWVSVEDDQQNDRKCWKISIIHPKDRCWTILELADTVGIGYGVCQILTENLNMCCIAAKFVPRFLTNDQKQWHVHVCLELWEKANRDPTFISTIITGDESWIRFQNWKWNWRDDFLKQCWISKGN
jgi:hypothetical protein